MEMLKLKNLKLKSHHKLGIAAFALGFIALFAGDPYMGSHIDIHGKELSLIVGKQADRIQPETLSDWIIQGRADYRLLDIRDEAAFAGYHIPTAENVPVALLTDYPLTRNEKILLVSETGIESSQAWMLLKAGDFKAVYMLDGGLAAWKEKILFPRIPENPDAAELERFEKMKEVSRFFGGVPQVGDAPEQETIMATPAVKPPTGIQLPVRKKSGSEEGC